MKALTIVYRVLIVVLMVLGLALIGGTVYGLVFSSTPPGHGRDGVLQGQQQRQQRGQTFTGIGQIRVPSADPQPGMVILFVSFRYDPDDKAFSEELALRIREFRDSIRNYIGSFSIAELEMVSEEILKAELLRRFNAVLRLGRLETLYFSDFLIVR